VKKYQVVTGISDPAEGAMGKRGIWRVYKPTIDYEKCVKCLRCWTFCPEGAIKRNKDGSVEINYDYCKGCGVCANECKIKAIIMEREGKKK